MSGSQRRSRDKRSVTVEVYGQRFNVRTDQSDEFLESISEQITEKLRVIKKATGYVETGQIALLALLDMADDLHQKQEAHAKLKKRINDQGAKLLQQIDEMSETLEGRAAVAVAGAGVGKASRRRNG